LVFITDVPSPSLLYGHCRTRSFQYAFKIENEGLFIAFKKRKHLALFGPNLKSQGFGIVVVDHSYQIFHDLCVIALEVPHALLVFILSKFL